MQLERHSGQRRNSRLQPPEMCPLMIVMLGKTGTGKNASGNTILGKAVFKQCFSSQSVTETCDKHIAEVEGRQITLIDTPGLFDTDKKKHELKSEFEKCVELSVPGPHAFLLMIRLDVRFTEEEKDSVKWIQENFGEEALKYTIVLFTHGDVLEREPVEEFLERSPAFSSIIEQCGNRYHILNNKGKDKTQINELLNKIEAMVEKNGGGHYSSDIFKKAQNKIKQRSMLKNVGAGLGAAAVLTGAVATGAVVGVTVVGAGAGTAIATGLTGAAAAGAGTAAGAGAGTVAAAAGTGIAGVIAGAVASVVAFFRRPN